MPSPARPYPAGTTPASTAPGPGAPTEEATTTEDTPTAPTSPRPGHTRAGAAGATPSARGRRLGRLLHARRLGSGVLVSAFVLVAAASPAYAAGGGTQTLSGLISNLTTWIVGILAGVATLFLTIGGLRYLTAGGDPGQVEKAKTALKSAAVGYALAVLAPLIVSILASLVGGG